MTTRTAVKTWTIDPVHSIAEFAVKHMMVSTVKGRFRSLQGTVEFDEADLAASLVRASIDVASIDTAESQRDAHLRSPDFFDAERFPTLTFESKRVEVVDAERWKLIGDLMIRGVTKEVEFDIEYEGQITDAYGKRRAAFTAETTLSRKDFGLSWNAVIETGGVLVGDKVRVTVNIAAVRDD
jgi:polyisoprenoid-binding protein YceI